jgi:hypothetical protein
MILLEIWPIPYDLPDFVNIRVVDDEFRPWPRDTRKSKGQVVCR